MSKAPSDLHISHKKEKKNAATVKEKRRSKSKFADSPLDLDRPSDKEGGAAGNTSSESPGDSPQIRLRNPPENVLHSRSKSAKIAVSLSEDVMFRTTVNPNVNDPTKRISRLEQAHMIHVKLNRSVSVDSVASLKSPDGANSFVDEIEDLAECDNPSDDETPQTMKRYGSVENL